MERGTVNGSCPGDRGEIGLADLPELHSCPWVCPAGLTTKGEHPCNAQEQPSRKT
ncbi:unnamed protein product, partial [Rangifer tarandus platyrhynchus]